MLDKWCGNVCIFNVNEMKYYKTNKIAIDNKTPIYSLTYGFDHSDLTSNYLDILVTEKFLKDLLSKEISIGFKNGDLYVLCNKKEIPLYQYMKDTLL